VKKEHAREKGFLQSRPSPWTLILRSLQYLRAKRMRVRDASLRSTRAGPCVWKCRAALPAAPPVILMSAATKNLVCAAVIDTSPVGADAHIGPPAQGLQIRYILQ